jgi:hypothetical protein
MLSMSMFHVPHAHAHAHVHVISMSMYLHVVHVHVCSGALDAAGWFHTGDLGRWEEVAADNDALPSRGAAAGGEVATAAVETAVETEVGGSRGAPRWRLRVVERLGFVVKLSNGEFLAPQRAEAEFEARCASVDRTPTSHRSLTSHWPYSYF